jgi:hypothetical protein
MGEHDKPYESGLPPMRAQDYSEMEDWPGYFEAVLGRLNGASNEGIEKSV